MSFTNMDIAGRIDDTDEANNRRTADAHRPTSLWAFLANNSCEKRTRVFSQQFLREKDTRPKLGVFFAPETFHADFLLTGHI